MSRQETQKKEAIEESRQMQLIDDAEANPQPDQAQLKAIRENQRRRQQQIEEKNQLAAAKKAQEEAERIDKEKNNGLATADPDDNKVLLGPIPQYPGRQLDPRGISSLLTKSVHGRMTTL